MLTITDVGGYFLHGITRNGDTQSDEEALIALFVQLSKAIPEAHVRLTTDMGEILMILATQEDDEDEEEEYAQCNNWLHEGLLKRIPFQKGADMMSFTVKDAYEYIAGNGKLIYDQKLHNSSLGWVPKRIKNDQGEFHREMAHVPRAIAALLHEHPEAICMANTAIKENLDSGEFPLPRDFKYFDVSKDLVEVAVKFPKSIFALWLASNPQVPPAWFSLFRARGHSITHESAMVGAQITGSLDFLISEQTKDVFGEPTAISAEDLKGKFSEQSLFDESRKKAKTTVNLGTLKEEVDEYLDKIVNPPLNILQVIKSQRLPSDEEIKSWPRQVDSRAWFLKLMESLMHLQEEGSDGLEAGMKKFMIGINQSLEKGNDKEIYGVWEDDTSSDSSSDNDFANNVAVTGPDGKPFIDMDDFAEFFMRDALKLSAEEVERYRAGGNANETSDTEASISQIAKALNALNTGSVGDEDSDSDIDISQYVHY